MNTSRWMRLLLSWVQFPLSGIFLITFFQLTTSAQLNNPLPIPQTGEDFENGSEVGIEETTTETGRLEEPQMSSDGMAQEMHVIHYTNKTLPSLETPTPSPSVITIPPASPGEVPHVNNNYPADLFSLEERRRGWVTLHIVGMLYMFVSLIVVCDHFFIPALGVIIDKLGISEDVAGATFMAAGRSIPKFFSLLMGVLLDHSNASIGSVVGSAVFNFLFVIGMCGFFCREILHLNWWPLFRDTSFYTLGFVLLIIFFLDNVMMWWESVMLVACYILYVSFMKFNAQAKRAFKMQRHKHKSFVKAKAAEECKKVSTLVLTIDLPNVPKEDVPAGEDGSEDSDEDVGDPSEIQGDENKVKEEEEGKKDKPLSLHWPDTRCKQVSYVFLLPIVLPLRLTVPDVHNQKSRKFFVVTYAVSILWIGVFSYLMMWWAHQVGETFGSPYILPILAAMTSNPDLITSVIVARKGLGDMAVSSTVGSNIFDITMSLPVPWLLYSFIHGFTPMAVSSKGVFCATVLLFLMLLFAIISIISCKWKMNKVLGVTMLLLYLLFLILSIMLQYRVIVCPIDVE
ncbi:sodium/potassium/calcium exchanger 1-like [Leuresthes tenuis]|uniref:sodium/potassium/calcium exchanger 1-like n=1 Tax=Leuresthes tenuis TaxID=355514 RepID=UPI003B50F670